MEEEPEGFLELSSRFKGPWELRKALAAGGGRLRAASEGSDGTLPSFSAGLSSGPFVFEESVKAACV